MLSLRSLIVWCLTWLYMLAAGAVCLPWVWLTGRLGPTYRAGRSGVRLLLRLAGVRVVVSGREHVPAAGPVIFMANHQSNLDPPVLVVHLPGQISFLAKKELFSVPVLGTVLAVAGLVPVDRADRAAAQASVARAAAAVRAGRPFLIFPEGTRSPDAHLLEFKKGPFYLAQQAQAPVVPVSLRGSGALMPRGQWRIRPGSIEIRIHPPISPEQWAGHAEPRTRLAELVRQALSGSPQPQASRLDPRPSVVNPQA